MKGFCLLVKQELASGELSDAVRIMQMNADYENQGILPRTCTCDSIKVRGKGKRSYAFSEDFEDNSV